MRTMKTFFLMVAILTTQLSEGWGGTMRPQFRGQLVYVPVYSHIYTGNNNLPFYLTATLSIRNTDSDRAITVTSVDYYDSDGRRVKRYVDKPVIVPPMASVRYVVQESDKTGGSGANFMVRWNAAEPASPPLMEAVMISTKSSQGVSFTSRGQVIEEEL